MLRYMFVEIELTGLFKNPDTQIKTGLQYRFKASQSIILDLVQSIIVMINYSNCCVCLFCLI